MPNSVLFQKSNHFGFGHRVTHHTDTSVVCCTSLPPSLPHTRTRQKSSAPSSQQSRPLNSYIHAHALRLFLDFVFTLTACMGSWFATDPLKDSWWWRLLCYVLYWKWRLIALLVNLPMQIFEIAQNRIMRRRLRLTNGASDDDDDDGQDDSDSDNDNMPRIKQYETPSPSSTTTTAYADAALADAFREGEEEQQRKNNSSGGSRRGRRMILS